MIHAFCRAANLRHLLQYRPLQGLMKQLQTLSLDRFTLGHRGTLLNDIKSLSVSEIGPQHSKHEGGIEVSLNPFSDVYLGLVVRLNSESSNVTFISCNPSGITGQMGSIRSVDPQVRSHHRVQHNGVNYTTAATSPKDSLVLFRSGEAVVPGQIESIFDHVHPGPTGLAVAECFFAVRIFQALNAEEAEQDPYRRFPYLDCSLFHNDPSVLTVIKNTDLISHFASCPYRPDRRFRVVLSLDRVIPSFARDLTMKELILLPTGLIDDVYKSHNVTIFVPCHFPS